jgi:hypothetical protein
MNTKTPECWSSDPNAHGVKIELSAERSLLLPFDQFAFAELKTEGKHQHLRLVFATHEVLIGAFCRIEARAANGIVTSPLVQERSFRGRSALIVKSSLPRPNVKRVLRD